MIIWHELVRFLFNILIFLYNNLGQSMGLAIITLTILIRLVLWPSQGKALRAQKDLNALQPELKQLQEKHKGDQAKQAKAMMDFYKERKVSPFSSCLPLLIQFPLIIALYQVFRVGMNQESLTMLYPFIHRPDSINTIFLGYWNLAQPEKYVLPVLTGLSQFIQTRMAMPKTAGQTDNAQMMISKQMIYFLPIMTIVIAMSLPAALPLYWFVTTLIAIIQQYFINKAPLAKKKVIVTRKAR